MSDIKIVASAQCPNNVMYMCSSYHDAKTHTERLSAAKCVLVDETTDDFTADNVVKLFRELRSELQRYYLDSISGNITGDPKTKELLERTKDI
jgi:hypothetical protein